MKTRNSYLDFFLKAFLGVFVVTLFWGLGQANGQGLSSPVGAVSTYHQEKTELGAPVPGGPGYLTLSAFSFVPWNTVWNPATYAHVSATLRYTGAGTAIFEAPLNLPHGATINKVTIYYYDDDAALNFNLGLYRYPMDTAGASLMASVPSSSQSASYRNASTTTITNPVVDLASYSYILQLQFPGSASLYFAGARVDYGFGISLPSITNN